MFGGLAARGRLLVVADSAGVARIQVYDLDDRRLASRFRYGDDSGYTDVGGIALAPDSSLWLPDTRGNRLRRFSLFGNEGEGFGPPGNAVKRDRRGLLVRPRAVAVDAHSRLWVCCGDRPWVHGLQVFDASGRFEMSVASGGRREASFGPATGLCVHEDRVWVADFGSDRVQCFRDTGAFVGTHDLGDFGEPLAIAVWAGGQAVLAMQPAPVVLLYDRNYRRVGHVRAPAEDPLRDPSGVAALEDELLVLDRDAARVRSFGLDGVFRETVFDSSEW